MQYSDHLLFRSLVPYIVCIQESDAWICLVFRSTFEKSIKIVSYSDHYSNYEPFTCRTNPHDLNTGLVSNSDVHFKHAGEVSVMCFFH